MFSETYTFFDLAAELPGSWSTSGGTKTINGVVWSYSTSTYIALDNTHTKIQVGSAKKPQTTNWTISTPISNFGAISSISVTAYTTATSATYDISANGSSLKSGNLTTGSNTYSTNALNITDGDIIITLRGSSSSKAMYLCNVSITYSDTPPAPCNNVDVTLLDTENGSASLSETEICEGSSVEVTDIQPDEGYILDTIACLTTSYQPLGSVDMSTKTISGITEDCYVMVLFKKSPLDPDVDIVEWNPDYIKIDVENFENAELTAIIQNKNTQEVHDEKVADSLFFSKYFEAAGSVKLIALYNGTNHDIDLSEYSFSKSQNGKSFTDTKFKNFKLSNGSNLNSDDLLLESGEEIIFISYNASDQYDTLYIKCAKNNEHSGFSRYHKISTPELNFDGNDAVGLKNPENNFIDLIGAPGLAGVVNKTGRVFMDDDGWYSPDGININTNDSNYALSTNRCLLIRKNFVKSGLNAVARNDTNFVTLGGIYGEWKGLQIPGTTVEDKIANTCAAFDTIGTFDYNAYYATYQTLETIDLTEDGFLQSDGTYRINIDDLDQLSCTQLKVIVSDDDTEVEKEYKIPIMVKTNSKTTDKIFTDEGSDCATCDVVVLAGKKLTAAGTESTNRDLKLYQGAELIIPEDSTYRLTSLSIQKYNDSVAALNVDGTLVVNKLYFDLYLTRGVWSYVALPDTFTSRKVKFANGNVAEYGEDYSIGYYDGSYRAQHGRGGWKFASADQKFAPGIGFIISLNDNYKSKELRIELPVDSILGELHNKNITNLHSWPATAANDIGWNLVGNPYMAIYQSDLGDPIHIGELVQEDSDPWNGRWTYRGNSRYAVVPSTDPADAPAGYYKSVLLSEYKLNPFTAFFIQLGGESNSTYGLNFHADHRTNRVVRKVTETEESFLRIIIGDYKTGCFISDKFTDEYEPGDDLESNYPIYQEIGGYKLLYSAINDSVLEAGINVYSNGGNVLLDNKTDINSFEYIYLNYENEWFDLLHENIINIPGNFKLFGKRKCNLATDLEYIPTNGIFKFMKDGSVYINKNNQIFNILGQIQ